LFEHGKNTDCCDLGRCKFTNLLFNYRNNLEINKRTKISIVPNAFKERNVAVNELGALEYLGCYGSINGYEKGVLF